MIQIWPKNLLFLTKQMSTVRIQEKFILTSNPLHRIQTVLWIFVGISVCYLRHFSDAATTRLTLFVFAFFKAKFLVDHEGKTYKRYDPKTPPFDMKDDIEMLLKKRNDH